MSGLIKAGDRSRGLAVAAFEGGAPLARPGSAAQVVPDDPAATEIARLKALIASKDEVIAELRDEATSAHAKGVREGREAMELEFEDNREKALELLEKGIDNACRSLAGMHERMEVLALLVSRTALEKLFDEDDARAVAVTDLARLQLARIEQQSVIAVEVSRMDFPDTREVADLARKLGMEPEQVAVSDALDAGACRIRMKLGTIDAGLDQQWGAVRDLLDSVAEETLLSAEGEGA